MNNKRHIQHFIFFLALPYHSAALIIAYSLSFFTYIFFITSRLLYLSQISIAHIYLTSKISQKDIDRTQHAITHYTLSYHPSLITWHIKNLILVLKLILSLYQQICNLLWYVPLSRFFNNPSNKVVSSFLRVFNELI